MTGKKETCILIPALNPGEKLSGYVQGLLQAGFEHIIIVNDGSDSHTQYVFDAIENMTWSGEGADVFVIQHAINWGKGRALKNGINYYLVHLKDKYAGCKGIITVDSDGQHLIEDVSKMSDRLAADKAKVILGCRDFDMQNVPAKSRFGNQITRTIVGLLFGKKVTDTQTGLRAFSNEALPGMLELYGERFEYETNVLIECIKEKFPIEEVAINTVYEDNNSGTHFRPVADSFKIYMLIFRRFISYVMVSLSSFVLDCTLFWLIFKVLSPSGQTVSAEHIWAATAGARCVSSLYNYIMNKYVVFEHRRKALKTLIQYLMLCAAVMFTSALCVSMLYSVLGMNEVLIKCAVDTLLFFVSYFVQDKLIFAG